jgi:hypothetical protein
MLSWFRQWGRPIASAALVSLVTLTISTALPHADDCHGAECGAVALHDPSGHNVERSKQAGDQPNHCVVCHWTRSVRPAPETTGLLVPVDVEDARITIDVLSLPSQTSLLRPSLRAPPASPRLV